jgi:MazG family protein
VVARDDLAGALLELQELAERLRRDCPWDRRQTARTIVPHTVEEAYEVADAAAAGDDDKLLDEVGDLLFQAYFLALLLEEKGTGDLAAAARRIRDKLVRRHPHVFGDDELDSAGAVKRRWEELKREQEGRDELFHHVPETLPALLHARKAQQRAAGVGFDWLDAAGPLAKLREELDELEAEVRRAGEPAAETEPDARVASEVGDLLFTAVNLARRLNVDPELALRAATQTFVARVERAAALAAERGEEWRALALDEQDRYYERAKGEP